MSSIISPILLDSTGQDINETLKSIKEALCTCRQSDIDDTLVSDATTWSSEKIVNTFTSIASLQGSLVEFVPIAATPITVITTLEKQTTLELKHSNGELTSIYKIVVPAAGIFNLATGELILEDGSVVLLKSYPMIAFDGTNTLEINVGSMEVQYHIVTSGSSEPVLWDVICGGTSAEEA